MCLYRLSKTIQTVSAAVVVCAGLSARGHMHYTRLSFPNDTQKVNNNYVALLCLCVDRHGTNARTTTTTAAANVSTLSERRPCRGPALYLL